jgi:Mg-chelatase subunit ChlD
MTGEKMRALNAALKAMLPPLVSWQHGRAQVRLLLRVLAFATEPRWHVPGPVPVARLAEEWRDLECVPRGRTNMAPAFRAVAEVLAPGRLERRALRPAVLLITDGLPTDPPGEFDAGLAELIASPLGRSSLRLAVAVGQAANSGPLSRFRSPDTPVFVADGIDEIADRLLAASVAVSQLSGV